MGATEIAKLLFEYKLLGIIGVLMAANLAQAKWIKSLYEKKDKESKEKNDTMLTVMERRVETDVKHTQAYENMTKSFDRLSDRL